MPYGSDIFGQSRMIPEPSIKLLILIFGLLMSYQLGIVLVVVVGPLCGLFLLTNFCTDSLTYGVAVFLASFIAPSTAFCVARSSVHHSVCNLLSNCGPRTGTYITFETTCHHFSADCIEYNLSSTNILSPTITTGRDYSHFLIDMS